MPKKIKVKKARVKRSKPETKVEKVQPAEQGETKPQVKFPRNLTLAIKKLEKKFGEGIVKRANSESLTINRLLTGIKSLDTALGGGIPIGMITEFYGEESGGKSTIVAKLIANAQKIGATCAYIDAEKALDKTWLEKLGVDWQELLHSEVTDADNVFDIAKSLIQTHEVKVLIIDSVAALTPKKEVEEDMEKQSMGVVARIVGKGLRVSNTVNNRQGTAIVFINQLREKIGIMFGDNKTTPGGKALKFFSGIRVDVKRGEWWPDKSKPVDRLGVEVICRIVKNKTSPPYKEARFVLMTDGRIKEWSELRTEKKEEPKKEEIVSE
jgi:recombination protein RecA